MPNESKKLFCYKCGQPCSVNAEGYAVCGEHGTLWALRRNSICGEVFAVNGDGKVLFIKRATEPMKGTWAIPGGFTNYGEHPRNTAVREAFEETGWRVRLTGEVLGVYMDSFPDDKNSEHRIVVSYLAQPIEEDTRLLDGETDGHEWFDVNDLPDSIMPNHLGRISDYQQRTKR